MQLVLVIVCTKKMAANFDWGQFQNRPNLLEMKLMRLGGQHLLG